MTGCADAVLASVRREIELRRTVLDGATDLGEVTIRVRLMTGTAFVRGIVWEEERIYRKSAPERKECRDTIRS